MPSHFAFRLPHSAFRTPHSAFRIGMGLPTQTGGCTKPGMNPLVRLRVLLVFAVSALALSCSSTAPPSSATATAANDEAAVRAVLEQQLREWNAGNLAGFMGTYARSENTHFASGGTLRLGWQDVFNRYKERYGDPAAMGVTTFSGLEVTMLGPDTAMAFGRWHQKGSKGEGSGLFTLILRRLPEGWRIVHDHTSAAPKEDSQH